MIFKSFLFSFENSGAEDCVYDIELLIEVNTTESLKARSGKY